MFKNPPNISGRDVGDNSLYQHANTKSAQRRPMSPCAHWGKADIDYGARKLSFDTLSVNGGPPSSAGRGKVFRQRRSPTAAYRKSPEKIRERFPAVKTTDRRTVDPFITVLIVATGRGGIGPGGSLGSGRQKVLFCVQCTPIYPHL